MSVQTIVPILAFGFGVTILMTSKYWLGTKIGDVIAIIIVIIFLHGCISTFEDIHKWWVA